MATLHVVLALMCVFPTAESRASGSFSDEHLNRLKREVGVPSPIDCQLSEWGEWSECDPCREEKFRSRSILKFGQYGGRRCLDSLGETRSCKPTKPCEKEPIECGNDFECDSGRCIKKRLVCNGDNDCGDYSDESCDDEPKSPCRANPDLQVSEFGRTAGNGVNILGMDTRGNPFHNEYFHGICDRVFDGHTRTYFRKPWNTAALTYETKADKYISSEVFTSSMAVMTSIIREETNTFQIGLSIKTTPTENNVTLSLNAGLNYAKNESLQKIKEYSQVTNKEFLRVKGNLQVGTFQIRSRETMLTDAFIDDLKALPPIYDKGEYLGFLETYGTHYAVSGNLGGKYELVYVLDSNVLKSKDVTAQDVSECLGYNVNVEAAAQGITGGGKIDGKKCSKSGERGTIDPGSSGVIKQIIPFVKGGTIGFAAKLNEKLASDHSKIDVDDYVAWASSLIDAPVVIKLKPAPIYTLVPAKMENAYEKKKNLERSIADYLDEYSECRCQPCQNGGTVILVDGECLCECSPYFGGIACQTRKSELLGNIPAVDGKWGCWSAWSECVNKSKTRRRQCNNPAPGPGGSVCQGMNVETEEC